MKRNLQLTEEHLNQEVTVALRLRDLLRLAESEPAATASAPQAAEQMQLPVIGSEWEDGIYAGVTLDGEQRCALILMPGDFNGTWSEAKDWADKEDAELPSRIDQLVLFKNLKSEFKEAWYWSAEAVQHAEYRDYAWGQGFDYGGQGWTSVSSRDRARAVRRIPIR